MKTLRYEVVYSLDELKIVASDLGFYYFAPENDRFHGTKPSDFIPSLCPVKDWNFYKFDLCLGIYIELVKVSTLNPRRYYQPKLVWLCKASEDDPYTMFFSSFGEASSLKEARQIAKKKLEEILAFQEDAK